MKRSRFVQILVSVLLVGIAAVSVRFGLFVEKELDTELWGRYYGVEEVKGLENDMFGGEFIDQEVVANEHLILPLQYRTLFRKGYVM